MLKAEVEGVRRVLEAGRLLALCVGALEGVPGRDE